MVKMQYNKEQKIINFTCTLYAKIQFISAFFFLVVLFLTIGQAKEI